MVLPGVILADEAAVALGLEVSDYKRLVGKEAGGNNRRVSIICFSDPFFHKCDEIRGGPT